MSTNTKREPTNIGPFNKGMYIFLIMSNQLEPSPLAASSRFGAILSRPESIDPFEIVKNLIIYPQISRQIGV